MSYTWVEPFAGAAAVALRLVGGRDLVPPVRWMGGKRRLARPILDAMGVPRGRPARIVLVDAGPWGWVWPLLLAPSTAGHVAAILRSWGDEHPRELWERLARVPPAEDLAERAAQWLWLQARSASGVPVWWSGWRWDRSDGKPADDKGPDRRWEASNGAGAAVAAGHKSLGSWEASDGRGAPRPVGQRRTAPERWEQGSGESRPPQRAGQRGREPIQGESWRMGEEVSKARRGDRTVSQCGGKLDRWEQHGGPRQDRQRATARASQCSGRAWQDATGRLAHDHGPNRRDRPDRAGMPATGGIVRTATIAARIEGIAAAFADVAVVVHHGVADDAAQVISAMVDRETVAVRCSRGGPVYFYVDPPYVGRTGYGWDCPREAVLALATSWASAGAVVAVSEAVPLEIDGWHHLELTGPGGKPEWLTLSCPPARRPARQGLLFEGAA